MAQVSYDEWGRPNIIAQSLNPNYTGHEYDQTLGVYYAKARFYNPANLRMVSPDPIKGNTVSPQSLNVYTYVSNNPVKYIDPLGLEKASVNINGVYLTVDTSKKQDVINMLAVFDSAVYIAPFSNQINVYNYATKKVGAVNYGKDYRISDILRAAGFTKISGDSAYFTRLSCGYRIHADNKFINKIGLSMENILSKLRDTDVDNAFLDDLKYLGIGLEDAQPILYILQNNTLDKAEQILNELNWKHSGAASIVASIYRINTQFGTSMRQLDADYQEKFAAERASITNYSIANLGNALAGRLDGPSYVPQPGDDDWHVPKVTPKVEPKSMEKLSDKITGNSYDINKLYRTQSYTYPETVSSIKESIVNNGPNSVPPIEIRVHNGEALVVDGHNRLEAFRQLGYDRVPIKYLHSSQLGKTLPNGTYYRSIGELLAGKISN